jgi:hypothetical protein
MRFYIGLLFAVSILGCAQKEEFPIEPTLQYIGASKNKMKQSPILKDTVFLKLAFTDGDGDIGYLDGINRVFDLIITDKRTGKIYDQFIVPSLPQKGVNNGIKGTMDITLFTTCCILQPCDPFENQPDEKLPLEIYLKDRAGNKSNVVQIDNLTLQCKK